MMLLSCQCCELLGSDVFVWGNRRPRPADFSAGNVSNRSQVHTERHALGTGPSRPVEHGRNATESVHSMGSHIPLGS